MNNKEKTDTDRAIDLIATNYALKQEHKTDKSASEIYEAYRKSYYMVMADNWKQIEAVSLAIRDDEGILVHLLKRIQFRIMDRVMRLQVKLIRLAGRWAGVWRE